MNDVSGGAGGGAGGIDAFFCDGICAEVLNFGIGGAVGTLGAAIGGIFGTLVFGKLGAVLVGIFGAETEAAPPAAAALFLFDLPSWFLLLAISCKNANCPPPPAEAPLEADSAGGLVGAAALIGAFAFPPEAPAFLFASSTGLKFLSTLSTT